MTHPRPHFKTLEEIVGKTPLAALQRLEAESLKANDCVVLGKLEGNNPAGSVKDRPALSMIAKAQDRGEIKPGDTSLSLLLNSLSKSFLLTDLLILIGDGLRREHLPLTSHSLEMSKPPRLLCS